MFDVFFISHKVTIYIPFKQMGFLKYVKSVLYMKVSDQWSRV